MTLQKRDRISKSGCLIYEGQLTREPGMIKAGQQKLGSLMRRAFVPHEKRFDLSLILGEALANAYLYHQNAFDGLDYGTVGYRFVADIEHVAMFIAYRTPWFNSDPPAPSPDVIDRVVAEQGVSAALSDPLLGSEHGRGILIMRGLSTSIFFDQSSNEGLILGAEVAW